VCDYNVSERCSTSNFRAHSKRPYHSKSSAASLGLCVFGGRGCGRGRGRGRRTRTRTLCIRRTLCRHVTIGTPTVIFAVFWRLVHCWYTVVFWLFLTIGVPIVTGLPRLYQQCTNRQKQSKDSQNSKNDRWCTNRHMSTQSPTNTQSPRPRPPNTRSLHLLPVRWRIQYKLCFIMHSVQCTHWKMPGLAEEHCTTRSCQTSTSTHIGDVPNSDSFRKHLKTHSVFNVHWHLRDFCTVPMAAVCNRRTINLHRMMTMMMMKFLN